MVVSRSYPSPLLDVPGGPLTARLRAARALAARHRRLAAAMCAGTAVLAAVSALTPAGPTRIPGEAGVAPVALPAGAGAGAAGDADRVAVTVRLADSAGTLLLRPGIHIEVIGGAPAGSAAADGAADAVVLAADAVVLVVPQPGGDGSGDASADGSADGSAAGSLLAGGSGTGETGLGGVAVLAVAPADAHRLAAAAGTRALSVAVALPPS